MRLALLIGANPRLYKGEATCFIPKGCWRLVVDGLEDSKVILKNHALQLDADATLTLDSGTVFTPEFLHRGSERSISMFAEQVWA